MRKSFECNFSEHARCELVEDDEVHAGEMIGEPTLASVAGLGLEPVDEIDHVVEPAAGSATGRLGPAAGQAGTSAGLS
jgi:hypothetical protein